MKVRKKNMSRNIKELHPWLQYKIGMLQKDCKKKGLKLGIGECYRTVKEQDALYAKGRKTTGPRVTNAQGSSWSSQHQWGVAFDVFQNIKGKEYDVKFLKEVAKIAKKHGLGWGGDWKEIVDRPHFYLKKWGSTPKKLKEKYGTFNNFKKTWKGKVTGTKKGLNVWNKAHTKVKIKKLKNGTSVNVMYHKIFPWGKFAKVEYKGTVGWMKSKYLK